MSSALKLNLYFLRFLFGKKNNLCNSGNSWIKNLRVLRNLRELQKPVPAEKLGGLTADASALGFSGEKIQRSREIGISYPNFFVPAKISSKKSLCLNFPLKKNIFSL